MKITTYLISGNANGQFGKTPELLFHYVRVMGMVEDEAVYV